MSLFQLSWVNRFGVLNSGSLWNIKVTKPSKTFPNHRNHVFETSDSSAVGGTSPWESFAAWRVVFGSNVMAKPLVSWNAGACVKHSQRPPGSFSDACSELLILCKIFEESENKTLKMQWKCSLDEMKTKPWNLVGVSRLFLMTKMSVSPIFFELKRFNENLQKNERQSCKLYTFTTYKQQNIRPSHGYPVKGHKVGPYQL